MSQLLAIRIGNDCPRCGKALCVRSNRRDQRQFLGCTAYPVCRFTEDRSEVVNTLLAEVDALRKQHEGAGPGSAELNGGVSRVIGRVLKQILFVCHPDHNGGNLDANTVTAKVIEIRKALPELVNEIVR